MATLEFDINSLKINKLFYIILNSLHDGVLVTDQEGYIKYANSAYSRLTGVVIDEVIDKKIQDVRKGARLPEVLKTGNALLGIKRRVNQIEYIADINPIFLDGKVVGAISIVRDITELEELSNKIRDYSYKVTELNNKVKEIHRAKYNFDDIIGQSKEIIKAKNMARRIAERDMPVLILGESGTGKELVAHAIHNASPMAGDPFVAVNCAAFSPNLLVSELFGYEEGAFTGASKGGKLGLFELANGGTLFLDEIGDMDYELQSKLLRVIETGEFIRIGGTKPIKVYVRIISATNKDLEKLIQNTKFREDLFYRLNVVSLKIPPLRNRLEDIPLLIDVYLKRLNERLKKQYIIKDKALEVLSNYLYPGNVRELFNVLEFAIYTCETMEILPEDLPIITKMKNRFTPINHGSLSSAVKVSEKDAITDALNLYGTSVEGKQKAARHLGISLATLYNKIKHYSI